MLDLLYLSFIDRLWSGEGRYQLRHSQHPGHQPDRYLHGNNTLVPQDLLQLNQNTVQRNLHQTM